MGGDKTRISPIMTNSESIYQFGNNAYGKPATALNILRETVMGRDLFDHAFKEYSRRWAFKHSSPADFFRTMEDASEWTWIGSGGMVLPPTTWTSPWRTSSGCKWIPKTQTWKQPSGKLLTPA